MEVPTLRPPGERETVDAARAKEIVSHWQSTFPDEKFEKVALGNKAYTGEAAEIIGAYIASDQFSRLKVADLADVIAGRMEVEGLMVLKALCDAVGKHRELVEVDLSDNAMGLKGIAACTSALEDQRGTIQRLSMCNDGLSGESMNEVANILCQAKPSPLTKIHFFNNMSGDPGCYAFKKILSNCEVLENIRFSGTRAQRPGSLEVAKEFDALGKAGKLSQLKYLDLNDNTFGEEGGSILASALSNCPNLEYLGLRDCVLGDEATTAVCKALKCPLSYLDLSGNDLTAKGAKSVAKLLKSMNTLQTFYCEENEMTSRGIAAVANALGQNISVIKLGSNECGSIGAKALVSAASRLKSLKEINLDGNMFPVNDVEELAVAFGDRLLEMEDNDDEEDVDENLESDDDNDNDDDDDTDVADLGERLSKVL
mmetsp:Transcript_37492/g.87423  ORF Transcript_37492/g.87423 Transcript_37492/m.87423 type:complete len:427 (-) Transcript_37492:119-1399(-)|eukprot:CAMPEP_0113313274 /NCGR_PEP_ID=MMETSP0010_2-20120614/9764_1 /TAXON_ID=216773 ORGANISM="Corethron hystrix, Strain 308" /NCGR_SAMPLE_ID=MMETSP0010_2 /ASSEMBLY_ACC=CAM_ASM_000155 /LENGTH=426 /DNA_ID=CAMNT_0000169255 /DNA_START=66 /DNA_END=1346 /DNA_ORIENTATION=- /assembly_acc=CAM_ASM_000155